MATPTLAARMSALEEALLTLVASQTAAVVAPVAPKARTFATKADIATGKGFPCTADEPCSRTLRTIGRAGSHGIETGHVAR